MKKDDFVLNTSWGWMKRIPKAIGYFFKHQYSITYFLWGVAVGEWLIMLCDHFFGGHPGVIECFQNTVIDAPSFLCGVIAGLFIALVITLFVFIYGEHKYKQKWKH